MPSQLAVGGKRTAAKRELDSEECEPVADGVTVRGAGDQLEFMLPIAGLAIGVPDGQVSAKGQYTESPTNGFKVLRGLAPTTSTPSSPVEFPGAECLSVLRRHADRVGQQDNTPRPPPRGVRRLALPDVLRTGIEARSGYDMSDVRVHHNSSRPAQVHAKAFTQGTEIYLAPGQDTYLPHEAWHVVQQKQGRVRATYQAKADHAVNNDAGLEREADVNGAAAAAGVHLFRSSARTGVVIPAAAVIQCGGGEPSAKGTMGAQKVGIGGEVFNLLSVAANYAPTEVTGRLAVVVSGVGLTGLALAQAFQAENGTEQLLAAANAVAAVASFASGVVGLMGDPVTVATADTVAYSLWAVAEFGNFIRVGYQQWYAPANEPGADRDSQHACASGAKGIGATVLAINSSFPSDFKKHAGNLTLVLGALASAAGHYDEIQETKQMVNVDIEHGYGTFTENVVRVRELAKDIA